MLHTQYYSLDVADTLVYQLPDVDAAVSKCIILPSGASFTKRDQSYVHHGGTCHAGGDAGAGNDSAVTWEDRKTQKACLERYRVASAEIIAVFHEVAPDAIVEKASIDEAYLDVTSIVDVHLRASLLTLLTPVHLRL